MSTDPKANLAFLRISHILMSMIATKQLDDCLLITMPASVGAKQALKLRDFFDDLLLHNNKNMVLDFKKTTQIDSSGIGALVYLFKRLHIRGLSMEWVGLRQQPLQMIQTLELDQVIKTS